MNILVCLKQIPSGDDIKIGRDGNLIRENAEAQLNPNDEFALEEALKLKDDNPSVSVSVLTMGPPDAEEILKYARSKGADKGYLLTDISFKASDTLATSYALACAARKINLAEKTDIILCSANSMDSDTAHVPAQLSAHLNIPGIFSAGPIISADENSLIIVRKLWGNSEKIKVSLPAVLSIEKNVNKPRLVSIKGKLRAKKFIPTTWSAKDIDCQKGKTGAQGSPTEVITFFTPETENKSSNLIEGTCGEKAEKLLKILKEKNFI